MAFVIPPLEDVRPPSWVKPGPKNKTGAGLGLGWLIPVFAGVYVAVVILLPALAVVAQAFAKGLGVFLESFRSE